MNIIIQKILSNVISSVMNYTDRTNNWNMHWNSFPAA